jgi:hypothetical protein
LYTNNTMFKTSGFMNEKNAAAAEAADAFKQATHSLILQKAMQNVKKENRILSSDDKKDFIPSIQSHGGSNLRKEEVTPENNEDFDDNDNEDAEFRRLREQRLQALKNKQRELQENLLKGHGKYEEVVEEDFLKAVTGSKYCVCSFYHRDFERCKIVDKHLSILTQKHMETRFIKIDTEKSRFFVAKLAIRMLPTIVCFVDGIAVDRIVGFDELGGQDDFQTSVLEKRLQKAKVIHGSTSHQTEGKQAGIISRTRVGHM